MVYIVLQLLNLVSEFLSTLFHEVGLCLKSVVFLLSSQRLIFRVSYLICFVLNDFSIYTFYACIQLIYVRKITFPVIKLEKMKWVSTKCPVAVSRYIVFVTDLLFVWFKAFPYCYFFDCLENVSKIWIAEKVVALVNEK